MHIYVYKTIGSAIGIDTIHNVETQNKILTDVSSKSNNITNNNNTELILSDLLIQYPDGSKSPLDRTQDLNNERIPVGTIRPGETVRQKNSVVFFGEQNVKKNIIYS